MLPRPKYQVETYQPGALMAESIDGFQFFDEALAWLEVRLRKDPARTGRLTTRETVTQEQRDQLRCLNVELVKQPHT
jgi:hypothetical protein